MKILNHSDLDERNIQRSQSINAELRRLCHLKECEHYSLPQLLQLELSAKIAWISALQALEQSAFIRAAICQSQELRDKGFQVFPQLPVELRLKIWRLSIPTTHLQPRIHCVDRRHGEFISNQDVSPLLYTSTESRLAYLEATNASYAFQTYINFTQDIIYLPFMSAITTLDPYNGSWTTEYIRRVERRNANSRKIFTAFLEDESSASIQYLAFDSKVFLNIPSEEWSTEAHQVMRNHLAAWKEMCIVFDNGIHECDKGNDQEMSFQHLTARKKREKHCAYVRSYVRTLQTHDYHGKDPLGGEKTRILEPIKFRFVSLDFGQEFA